MSYQTINFKGAKINFCERGEGNAIVLLHGFTESLEIWNDFTEKLSEKYKVITVDLPGHGKSECFAEAHTMEFMANCVKAVLGFLNVEKCVMIGHSMGGYVALAFTNKFPEMISGFGLFHSSAFADTSDAKENRMRAIKIIRKSHRDYLNQFIPDLFAPGNVERLKTEIEKLKTNASEKMTAEGIIAAQLGMLERKEYLDLLSETDVPVLFILGKKDKRIPFEKAAMQINLPKHSEVTILDCGHMGYLEAPEETLHSIKSFAELVFSIIH
ncbi:MAG: alpha/beta hydrolase [Bacteroidales bacterium]|nr:alpha/beta hydrolase [Bacteroidales bacterium]